MNREERILQQIAAGKSKSEIASAEGISISTINRCMSKIDKNKIEEAQRKAEEEREKRLLQLIAAGKSKSEIASAEGVSRTTINRWISKIDKNKVEEAIRKTEESEEAIRKIEESEEAKRKIKESIEARLLEQIKDGRSKSEIASARGVTVSTINRWISRIDKDKVEEAQRKAEEEREERLLHQILAGKSQSEIASTEGVTQSTISRRISKIDKNKLIEENIIKKQKDGTLTKKDIIDYRNFLDQKYDEVTIDELALMIDLYIKNNQLSEAIKLVNSITNNEDMKKIDKEKLQQLKEKVIESQKQQRVKRYINLPTNEIATIIGISEMEVLKIKKALEQQSQEQEEKTVQITEQEIKQKLNNRTLTQQDIISYRQQLNEKQNAITMEEIAFMVNIYIKTMQSSKAIDFIDSIINNEEIKKVDKKKLQQSKEQVIAIKNRQEARKLLSKNTPTDVIAKKLEMEESQVIKIKEEMKQKRNKQQRELPPKDEGR